MKTYHESLNRHFMLIVFVLLHGNAKATVIDSFTPIDHGQDITFGSMNGGGHSYTGSFASNVLGGERDVEAQQDRDTDQFAPSFVARFEGAQFRVGGFGLHPEMSPTTGRVLLQYDGSGDEQSVGFDHHLNYGGTGIPLLTGSEGGFRIWFWAFGTHDTTTTVTLRRLGSVIESNIQVLGASHSGLNVVSFPFSSGALAQADSITFSFEARLGGSNDESQYLDHIDTILPEPSSLAAFGLGGMMLGLRFRKRRNA